MRRTFMALGATVALLFTAACGGGGANGGDGGGGSGDSGGTLIIGENIFPVSFDVNGYETGHRSNYFQAVFDTLLRQDANGDLAPGLATEWTYNDDYTELTLTIRDGVTFTDGTALTADVVTQNLQHFMDSSGPDVVNMQFVDSVETVDETHVKLTLSAPDPMLTQWMTGSMGYIASPDSWDNPDVATNPVGSGPYTLDTTSTVVGSVYVYTKNPEYWDDSYHVYDTLTINYYEDSTALLNALQGNQVDAASFSDPSSLPQVEGAGYTVNTSDLDWAGLILFDRDGAMAPALGDVRVRQAINYALDRDALLQNVAMGYGDVTSSIWSTAASGYLADLDSYYTYDVAKAQELMNEAGYADGFELSMPSSAYFPTALLTAVQQQLGEIGISVTYTDTGSNFIADILSAKYPATWMQLASFADWHTVTFTVAPASTFNAFKNEDPTVDGYIEIMQNGSEDERTQAAKDLNTYITEQAWFAPTYRLNNIYVTDSEVSVSPATDNVVPYLYNIQPAS